MIGYKDIFTLEKPKNTMKSTTCSAVFFYFLACGFMHFHHFIISIKRKDSGRDSFVPTFVFLLHFRKYPNFSGNGVFYIYFIEIQYSTKKTSCSIICMDSFGLGSKMKKCGLVPP